MFTVTPVTTNLMVLSFLSQKANRLPMDGLAFCKSMLIVPNHLLFQAARMLLECFECFKGTCCLVFQEPEDDKLFPGF